MRPRRGKNYQTVPLYEECALWESLLNVPFLCKLSSEFSLQRQGARFNKLLTPARFQNLRPHLYAGVGGGCWGTAGDGGFSGV